MFTSQIGGGDWVERKQKCGSILKPIPTVVGGNLPTFGSWFPKKVESEQVAQLMTTDPKHLGNLYKNSHWRELRPLILEKWSFRLNECTSEKFNGREILKVFEGITTNWSSVAFKLKIITLRVEYLLRYWTSQLTEGSTVCILQQFLAKKTRNRLGGPEEALFEHSAGYW